MALLRQTTPPKVRRSYTSRDVGGQELTTRREGANVRSDEGGRHATQREEPGEVDGGLHRHSHHRAIQARLSQHLHPRHPSPQSRRAGDGRSGLHAALHSGAGRPRSPGRVRRPQPSPAQGGGRMSARPCLRDRQPPQRVGRLRRRDSGHAAVEAWRSRHRHRRRFARLAPDRAHALSRLSRRGGGADQPDQASRRRPRRPDRLRRGAGLSGRHRGRRRRGRCGDPAAHRRGGGGGGVRADGVRGFRAGEGRARPLDLRHLSSGAGGARGVQALARGQWPLNRRAAADRRRETAPRDCGAPESTYDQAPQPQGSAVMTSDIVRGSKARPWLAPVLAALLALGAALAALHSFWYGQALKEFTAITEAKPDCAMAYWGIAMSVWNQVWAPPTPANLKKGSDAITQALALGAKTPRERDYLDALAAFYADHDKLDHRTRAAAYMRKMEAVAQRYADDREARIFYALSLLATADGLDKTYKNQLKAGEILEQVFAEKPQHPGPSHYIIHAYDYPALVDRALAAAQNYAICVTIVPHAIHMPSHTYVLLGRWKDTITANDAAEIAEADRGTPEDRIHALDYLVYAHLQLAQDAKAKEALDLALKIENDLLARKHDTGLRSRPFGVAAMEARWALERLDWAAAAQ